MIQKLVLELQYSLLIWLLLSLLTISTIHTFIERERMFSHSPPSEVTLESSFRSHRRTDHLHSSKPFSIRHNGSFQSCLSRWDVSSFHPICCGWIKQQVGSCPRLNMHMSYKTALRMLVFLYRRKESVNLTDFSNIIGQETQKRERGPLVSTFTQEQKHSPVPLENNTQ